VAANFLGSGDDVEAVQASQEPDATVLAESVGAPARFAAVYERHLDAVALYLIRRVGGGLAEDLAAEVFVRAFRARASYRPMHETARPWLFGIAANLVADHRRAERRRLRLLQRIAATAPSGTGSETPGLSADLVRCLLALPSADRDALLLVAWGELSYEETATALGVPVGTVRSRIARARSRLTEAIGERDANPGGERSAAAGGGAHV
jgi:RNA polymerase sigma factor (sigma-70 family)